MKVLYFGIYNPNYSRNRILISGLRAIGVEVFECNSRAKGLKKYWQLFRKHWKFMGQYDVMIVGFSGHSIVWFARLLTRKKIVFDAFVSQYLSNVIDRALYSPRSLKAFYYWLLDRYSCRFSNIVLLDTNAQIDYFIKTFGIARTKFRRILVGSDLTDFKIDQEHQSQEKFIVHWHGYIVPFDGVETIIDAAQQLLTEKQIRFRIITRLDSKGKKLKDLISAKALGNVEILNEVSPVALTKFLDEADICLGIFGDNKKARVVIPNKIFESMSRGKPVITARHNVIFELLKDGENVFTVNPNDFKDLSAKILDIKNNPDLGRTVGENALNLFKGKLTPTVLGKELLDVIEAV